LKRYGISKNEKIKRRNDFLLIYSKGKYLTSDSKKLRLIYLVENKVDDPNVSFAPVAKKQLGNAVWRNRIKRLIRESYRLNKEIIQSACREKGNSLKLILFPYKLNQKNNKKLRLDDIMPEVKELLVKIANSF